MHNSTSI